MLRDDIHYDNLAACFERALRGRFPQTHWYVRRFAHMCSLAEPIPPPWVEVVAWNKATGRRADLRVWMSRDDERNHFATIVRMIGQRIERQLVLFKAA